MDKLKRVVIKEELVELTGDYRIAIILNQFLYWSERVADFDNFIAEENKRIKKCGAGPEIQLSNGWIYKSAEELIDECLLTSRKKEQSKKLAESTVLQYIDYCIKEGWIDRRNNPAYQWDRTYQYRVNLLKLNSDLNKLGYVLEGYRFNLPNSKSEDANSNFEKGSSNFENHSFNFEDGYSDFENRSIVNQRAIPEITTEITTETTTERNKRALVPCEEIVQEFNNICINLSKVTITSEARKKAIQKIYKRFPDIQQFKKVFTKANSSTFLCGGNDRGWKADFDWLLKEANFIKTLEGTYDNKSNTQRKGTFNNYDQREYDYDELEKRLLGWDKQRNGSEG